MRRLRGRTHHLCTAAVVVRGGEVLWRHSERPELVMRPFSDGFIEDFYPYPVELRFCHRYAARLRRQLQDQVVAPALAEWPWMKGALLVA